MFRTGKVPISRDEKKVRCVCTGCWLWL